VTDGAARRLDLGYGYDALDRLTSVSGAVTESDSYDPSGNFLSKGGDAHTYADPAHAHAVTHVNGRPVAWYDANGNMTQRVELSGTQWVTYTQVWDADNRLVAVTDTVTGEGVRFAYDADGHRVRREDAQATTYYQGDTFELRLPLTTTLNTTASINLPTPLSWLPWTAWPVGARVRTYYSLNGRRVAQRDTLVNATAVTWLHGDHLGSVSLATDASRATVGELRYTPWGEARAGGA
jgi:YD repeat-containing protein